MNLSSVLGLQLPAPVAEHPDLWAAAAIVVLGLLYGLKDVLRLSPKRIWAISSVCFRESIRRRVLWIAPLAILGMVIVSQLQDPVDEQDAIRQTIKFCLFATGLVAVIITVILSATSLPKEIETKVIYTVVTKPTTRLELVLGKIVGFARTSAVILLIMGLATLIFLQAKSWRLQSSIQQRLDAGLVDPTSRATLSHYAQAGLLNARTLVLPQSIDILAEPPAGPDAPRYFFGAGDGGLLVSYEIDSQWQPAFRDADSPERGGLLVAVQVGFEAADYAGEDDASSLVAPQSSLPALIAAPDTDGRGLPAGQAPEAAKIELRILDANRRVLLDRADIGPRAVATLTQPAGEPVFLQIPPAAVRQLPTSGQVLVQIIGVSPRVRYFVQGQSVGLFVPGPDGKPIQLAASGDVQFVSRIGRFGYQLRGGSLDPAQANPPPVAVFRFKDFGTVVPENGQVRFELRTGIERTGVDDADERMTELQAFVLGPDGQRSSPVPILPESNRPSYFSFPAEQVPDGEFALIIQNLTPGHSLGINRPALSLVQAKENFTWNLLKSLLVIWLLSLLVACVALFCSTFLSWPIAIVLTLVILLGRWGVMQVGETASAGIGSRVATDLGIKDPRQAKVLSESVERLNQFLHLTSRVFPDITRFESIDLIQRGVVIPNVNLFNALQVLALFGLPTSVLAYVILRNKEVVP